MAEAGDEDGDRTRDRGRDRDRERAGDEGRVGARDAPGESRPPPPPPVEVPVVSGSERSALDTVDCVGIGGRLGTVARTPTVVARDAVETARTEGFDDLADLPVRELLARVADAGRRFEGIGPTADGGADPGPGSESRDDADGGPDGPGGGSGGPGGPDPPDGLAPRDRYLRRVARATGLPVGWADVSTHWLGYGLRHAAEALRAQSPTGGLDVYDRAAYRRERTVGLAFAPRVRVLGCVMPGNDPATYAWPALALALKVPVVVRPSDREPFTALRLARALRAAGVPGSAVHVLSGDRSLGATVAAESDHALVFGADPAVASYREDPAVEAYGPGRSVAVLGRSPTDAQLDSLARGVVRAGGRTCFNLTRVFAVGDADADRLADRLAARVHDRTTVGSVLDSGTDLPALPDRERGAAVAEGVAAAADAEGAVDVTARYREGPRDWTGPEGVRVAPTVLRSADSVEEFPVPFAGVTAATVDDARSFVDGIDPAYLGVAVGAPDVERAMARSPAVRKVYGGRYPASVDLRETHETYLAAVCYETTTYDPGPDARF